ncbi:MAG: carbon-nitrogen hydrolase family protein [Bradyrhizobiaceae bacterium]|nr:carbon-nitrogen hydrolase family protein [Bradyrhizobiaceae bacterium]
MTELRTFRAALVQMRTGRDVAANIDAAAKLIREAKAGGAEYVQTPEQTSLMELDRASLFAHIVEEERDPALAAFRELARELKVHLHVGSLAVKASPDKAANRTFFLDPNGEIIARYDKIHMFDVNLANGESYRESNTYRPGETAVVVALPFCRIGLSICYDVRFPALYRALAEAGAEVITVPAAFTKQTGEAHWHLLLRARAVETGCFVLAAAQGGRHENGRDTYGHSLVIDPWGRVIAEAGIDPGVIFADIDLAEVAEARRKIPALEHGRRFEIKAPPHDGAKLHLVDKAS